MKIFGPHIIWWTEIAIPPGCVLMCKVLIGSLVHKGPLAKPPLQPTYLPTYLIVSVVVSSVFYPILLRVNLIAIMICFSSMCLLSGRPPQAQWRDLFRIRAYWFRFTCAICLETVCICICMLYFWPKLTVLEVFGLELPNAAMNFPNFWYGSCPYCLLWEIILYMPGKF